MATPRQAQTGLRIANPPAGSIYLIDPTLRSRYQTLPLRATGALGRIEWRVDGRAIGGAAPDDPFRWPLARGRHAITARDASGQSAEITVLVK